MRETARYLLVSLAMGLVTVWGSENFFWSAPPDDLTVVGWLLTWGAYALVAGTVQSAVILTGARGWMGLYLAAVVFGYLIEGVVVGTVYDAFPFQLVWTAMAWHGLITGLCIFGMSRAAPFWPLRWHLVALVGLGLGGAIFASFWPEERAAMPPGDAVLFYLAVLGLGVPLANLTLDRLQHLPAPPRPVLWVLPGLALCLWIAQGIAAPVPQRLAFLPVVGLCLWAMRRLGGAPGFAFGPAAPVWRHLLFPLAPLITTLVAVPLWENGTLLHGNWIIAGISVPVSLALWLWVLWRAFRRKTVPVAA